MANFRFASQAETRMVTQRDGVCADERGLNLRNAAFVSIRVGEKNIGLKTAQLPVDAEDRTLDQRTTVDPLPRWKRGVDLVGASLGLLLYHPSYCALLW